MQGQAEVPLCLSYAGSLKGGRKIEANWQPRQNGISTYLHRVGKIKKYSVFDKMEKETLWDYILKNIDGGFLSDDLEKAGF